MAAWVGGRRGCVKGVTALVPNIVKADSDLHCSVFLTVFVLPVTGVWHAKTEERSFSHANALWWQLCDPRLCSRSTSQGVTGSRALCQRGLCCPHQTPHFSWPKTDLMPQRTLTPHLHPFLGVPPVPLPEHRVPSPPLTPRCPSQSPAPPLGEEGMNLQTYSQVIFHEQRGSNLLCPVAQGTTC